MTDRTWIRGVSQPLPVGETLLWSGSPDRRAVARHALHVRLVTAYFAAIILIGLVGALRGNGSLAVITGTLALQCALAGLVVAGIHAYAALVARSSVYAITDRRVVMKVGIVLPTTINIPLRIVEGADALTFADGTGQVAIRVHRGDRLGYVHLWPHARPWRLRHPEPMLRGLTATAHVVLVLQGVAAASGAAPAAPPQGARDAA